MGDHSASVAWAPMSESGINGGPYQSEETLNS
jgi:hypothetical protein